MLSFILMELSLLLLIFYDLFLIQTKNCEKENPDCFKDNPEIGRVETIGSCVVVILIALTLIMEILKVLNDTFKRGKRALGYGLNKINSTKVVSIDFNKDTKRYISFSSKIDSPKKRVKLTKKTSLKKKLPKVYAKISSQRDNKGRKYLSKFIRN